MKDNFELKQCSENDALEFKSGTYRIKKIIDGISTAFKSALGKQLYESLKQHNIDLVPGISVSQNGRSSTILYENYFADGVDCELLRVGGNSWEKGKFKINVSIEFIPEEVEESQSELESLRKEINN